MIYYSNKVAVLTSKKDYEEAHRVLSVALEKYPDSKRDFVKLGKLYGRKARLFELQDDVEKAMEWCEKSLLENSDYKVKK